MSIKTSMKLKQPLDSVGGLINEWAASPNKFTHLQVFLHHERENSFKTDYEFLMISPDSFGKVILQGLTYVNDFVILKVQDCITRKVGSVQINVKDANPRVLFICWQDINNMIKCDRITSDKDSLLDFEF